MTIYFLRQTRPVDDPSDIRASDPGQQAAVQSSIRLSNDFRRPLCAGIHVNACMLVRLVLDVLCWHAKLMDAEHPRLVKRKVVRVVATCNDCLHVQDGGKVLRSMLARWLSGWTTEDMAQGD